MWFRCIARKIEKVTLMIGGTLKKILLIGVAVATFSAPSHAEVNVTTGYGYLTLCENPQTEVTAGACAGLVLGIRDGVSFGQLRMFADLVIGQKIVDSPESESELRNLYKQYAYYCIPTEVVAGQLQQVLLKWLKENPKEQHSETVTLAAEAFKSAFPCKKK